MRINEKIFLYLRIVFYDVYHDIREYSGKPRISKKHPYEIYQIMCRYTYIHIFHESKSGANFDNDFLGSFRVRDFAFTKVPHHCLRILRILGDPISLSLYISSSSD